MPSKRTNDSVDRILEELNMQQAQAGLRDSVTDHQVDEILRSVGILSLPDEPLPEDKLAFPEGDALDDLLQKPVSQPAPAPAQPRPYTPVQQPDPQPVQPDARMTRPPEQSLPTVDKTGTQTFSGDTTGTGIIKRWPRRRCRVAGPGQERVQARIPPAPAFRTRGTYAGIPPAPASSRAFSVGGGRCRRWTGQERVQAILRTSVAVVPDKTPSLPPVRLKARRPRPNVRWAARALRAE